MAPTRIAWLPPRRDRRPGHRGGQRPSEGGEAAPSTSSPSNPALAAISSVRRGEPYAQSPPGCQRRCGRRWEAARGRGAVIVSHQLPIWVSRLHAEGAASTTPLRQCSLASVTSFTPYPGTTSRRLPMPSRPRALLSDETSSVGVSRLPFPASPAAPPWMPPLAWPPGRAPPGRAWSPCGPQALASGSPDARPTPTSVSPCQRRQFRGRTSSPVTHRPVIARPAPRPDQCSRDHGGGRQAVVDRARPAAKLLVVNIWASWAPAVP